MTRRSRTVSAVAALLATIWTSAGRAAPDYPRIFGPGPYETTKIADGLYTFTHSGARNIFIVTDDGVIVTDPLHPDAAAALRSEIAKVTDQPVKYVIYSHDHWDHVLGGEIFKDEGAVFISHFNCLASFFREPHPDLVMPDVTFERHYRLILGGRTLELLYLGPNHDECLSVMHVPDERIMFIVDLVTPGAVPGAGGLMRTTDPLETIRTLKEIEAMDFDRMIGGHGPPIAPKAAITERRQYLEALMRAVRDEFVAGTPYDQILGRIELPEFRHLTGYDRYLKRNAERMLVYYVTGP